MNNVFNSVDLLQYVDGLQVELLYMSDTDDSFFFIEPRAPYPKQWNGYTLKSIRPIVDTERFVGITYAAEVTRDEQVLYIRTTWNKLVDLLLITDMLALGQVSTVNMYQ